MLVPVLTALAVALRWRSIYLATVRGNPPRVLSWSPLPGGARLVVRVPRGGDPTEVVASADALASAYRAAEVLVSRDSSDASRLHIDVLRASVLDAPGPLTSPLLLSPQYRWGERLPLGVTVAGEPLTVNPEANSFLVGGEPGAGKSVTASSLVAALALDPAVELYGIDGKLVELVPFEPVMRRLAWSHAEACDLMDGLLEQMAERYELMRAQGLRMAPAWWGRIVLVIDELAYYTAPGAALKKQAADFSERLRRLLALGRAAGICVIASTQKPSNDVVDTSVRDLIRTRVALRCTTPQASDTILGAGRASAGHSAALIPAASRGRGLLLDEGSVPVRFRSYYLSDQDLRVLVAHAESLRQPRRRLIDAGQTDGGV